ncbi:MAG: DUF2089 domain-containing protein [bacterium]|nr:DUF2089 domain-containing protein [bacterium]
MSPNILPPRCPSCRSKLRVVKLECSSCDAELTGNFDSCSICSLEGKDRHVFDLFLAARGNLKQVQRELGVSYPTARQRVEEMFRKLEGKPEPEKPRDILARLKDGEIDVEEAERLLRGED